MTEKDKELYRAISHILWHDWDPAGINDHENLWDEYLGYTPHVFKLKKSGADKIKIADHLYRIVKVDLGMYGCTTTRDHCKAVAQKIVSL